MLASGHQRFLQSRFRRVAAVGCIAAMLVTSCGSGEENERLTVSAAASLARAFEEIATRFEAITPGVEVDLNIAGSSRLREQIIEGAPVDVFASADEDAMAEAIAAVVGAGEPVVFALNTLVIGVPIGNPGGVRSLEDFANQALFVGVCAGVVPCGKYADVAFERAGVVPSIDTREPDVRSLLLKIELGELDAGVVYRSDAIGASGRIESLDIPENVNVTAAYPIAVIGAGAAKVAARAFVAYVLSDEGRSILAAYGFELP
jgi:molybdate transport system substrate-binding protein